MIAQWNGKSGWPDTLANPAWDTRQRAYNTAWSRTTLPTPQLIIDGVADGTGRREGEFAEIYSRAVTARNDSPLAVGIEKVSNGVLKIGCEAMDTSPKVFDVVVISYRGKSETVKVGGGPNKRTKMVHVNVVRDMTKIDEWVGGPKVVELPDMSGMEGGLEHVVVLQNGLGGMIVAACKL
jgi:hypothetical protein